jgi:hypothetical protein
MDDLTGTPQATQPEPVVSQPEPLPDPEWIDSAGAPPEPEPVQQEYVQQQQPQYQYQQPYYPPQPDVTTRLNTFVQDPDTYIQQRAERLLQDRIPQILGPLAMHLQQMDERSRANQELQARVAVGQAREHVKRAYRDTLARDEGYRRNDGVRKMADGMLQNLFNQAAEEARQGYPQKLAMFSDPTFAPTFLAAIKARAGYQASATGPVQTTGAVVEGAAAQQPSKDVQLPPDLQEVASKMNAADRKELIESYKEALEKGDFIF